MKKPKTNILYCEDNETLAYVTKDNLELRNFTVDHVTTGEQALQKIKTQDYDAIIMDIMLPGMDGLEVVNRVRKNNNQTPIIFLSAKSMTEDKIEGLRSGADDYMTKPFSIEELVLRLEVCFKRGNQSGAPQADTYTWGSIQFIAQKLLIVANGTEKRLTQKESDILAYLASRPNQVIKRSDVLLEIWGEDDYFLGRSLDVFISRLRKILQTEPSLQIQNIHSVGFEFVQPF